MITMISEVIGVGPSRPIRLLPQPHWKTATRTPYAAPIDSRFMTAAFSGTTTDRKTSISSRNDATSTAPMKSGRVSASWPLRSSVIAVMPGDVDVAGDHVAHLGRWLPRSPGRPDRSSAPR